MMPLADARRRAEHFAAAADGHPVAVMDAETLAFLGLIEQLRTLDMPTPDPAFSADLRILLMAAAPAELVAAPMQRRPSRSVSTLRPRTRRVASVAAATCIVAGSGLGVAAASQSALPGDALYPIKRGIENVQVSVAGSHAGIGHQYLQAASTRLNEVRGLSITRGDDPSTPSLMSVTLDDFTVQATDGARELIAAYRQDGNIGAIMELRLFTMDSTQQLLAIDRTAPDEVEGDLLTAAVWVTKIDLTARVVCATCSALPPITAQDFQALQSEQSGLPSAFPEPSILPGILPGSPPVVPPGIPPGNAPPPGLVGPTSGDQQLLPPAATSGSPPAGGVPPQVGPKPPGGLTPPLVTSSAPGDPTVPVPTTPVGTSIATTVPTGTLPTLPTFTTPTVTVPPPSTSVVPTTTTPTVTTPTVTQTTTTVVPTTTTPTVTSTTTVVPTTTEVTVTTPTVSATETSVTVVTPSDTPSTS